MNQPSTSSALLACGDAGQLFQADGHVPVQVRLQIADPEQQPLGSLKKGRLRLSMLMSSAGQSTYKIM